MVESPRVQRSGSALTLCLISTALALTLALSLSCRKTRPVDPNYPVIAASPASLAFTVIAGGQTPPYQRIVVHNIGGGTLEFSATRRSTWLQVFYRGTAPDTIQVFVYALGLRSGIYRDTVFIQSSEAGNSPVKIAVSVTVLPGISVSPSSVVRSAYKNGPAVLPETLEVRSEGGGPKIYTVAPTPAWLHTDFPVGVATEKILLRFNLEDIDTGTYDHQMVISSDDAANRETSVRCSLSVASWRRRFELNDYTIAALGFSSRDTGWAAGHLRVFDGQQASLFSTVNGGETWRSMTLPLMGALSDLTITNDGRLWMPADSGRLLRKSSGSLEIITLPTRERLTGIAFSSDDTAWITAADGSLYRSENRGDTWVQQPSPATNALNAVAFADSRTGWLIGADGVVAATADGGENWQADTPGPEVELRHITISPSGSVWVVGSAGTILYRNWVGIKWIQIPSGVTEDLRKIAFAGPENGWIVGSNGTILHTNDGGLSWHRQVSGTPQLLLALYPVDSARVFVAGINAQILDTYCGGE